MTQTYAQSYEKSSTFKIITITNTTQGRSNKFKDTIFLNTRVFELQRVGFK